MAKVRFLRWVLNLPLRIVKVILTLFYDFIKGWNDKSDAQIVKITLGALFIFIPFSTPLHIILALTLSLIGILLIQHGIYIVSGGDQDG